MFSQKGFYNFSTTSLGIDIVENKGLEKKFYNL